MYKFLEQTVDGYMTRNVKTVQRDRDLPAPPPPESVADHWQFAIDLPHVTLGPAAIRRHLFHYRSILLLTLHVTDDIVRGISKAEPSNIALLVLVVFLYGTLVLAERRSGHVIMLLVGLFAAVVPVIHMRGAHYGDIAKSTGGFFFVWTLWALGGLGGVSFILAALGLWNLRRGQTT